MRRYLCIHFPNWPIQRLRHVQPEARANATGLYERQAHELVLAQCSHEARNLGVHPGMSVADARALAPEMLLYEADSAAARQALEELCLWSVRFSPLAGVEPVCAAVPQSESLLLDITGCEPVFGTEENLLTQAVQGLRKKGFAAKASIAPTLGAAWALAHFAAPEHSKIIAADPPALLPALKPLPIAALRLEQEALADLHALGIERVGELLKQPRSTLPSRFGAALIQRMDQIVGDAPEVMTPLRPAPEFHAGREFDPPVRSSELLFKIIEPLAAQLARELQAAERGAREIECWLFHELAQPVCVLARLFKGSASGKHLWKLLRVRLEDSFRKPHARMLREQRASSRHDSHIVVDAEEAVCAVALQVLSSEKMGSDQLPLFDTGAGADNNLSESLASLFDRLASRLGAGAVLRVVSIESAIPERDCMETPFQSSTRSQGGTQNVPILLERPLRLMPTPVPLLMEWPASMSWPRSMSWSGMRLSIGKITGPERVESGWWGESAVRRDYFVVESVAGARYWVFKCLDDMTWFLHGTFE